MIKNVIALTLLVVSVVLSFKHGWDTFNYKNNPQSTKIMADLGISEPAIPWLGALTILTGILLTIPKTFFLGNLLSAFSILLIMAFSLHAGNYKTALMEIPFLAMPLIMIWLKYPFKS
ncbi:hypothetical protein [Dyadobacter crusticola]|uniref:hypothetical protein n=1 Tax=Dyadobacter crusticola TaxID=292407 RepID=UPI0004E19E0C|nr:hypothetical protein [Dyadobacter crusticola]